MTTHYKIVGIVKRIGHCAGPGDKVEFIFETVQEYAGKYNLIHSTKFKNISLDCEYNSPYCAE